MYILVILFILEFIEAKKGKSSRRFIDPDNLDNYVYQGIKDFNILPETYRRPVDFQNIGRRGFGDIDFKEPLDFLALDMLRPKTAAHIRELLKKSGKGLQLNNKQEKPQKFLLPRDEMMHYKKKNKRPITKNIDSEYKDAWGDIAQLEKNIGAPRMYDFTSILEHNLAHPFSRSHQNSQLKNKSISINSKENDNRFEHENISASYFDPHSFAVRRKMGGYKYNWTTCDEFAKGALFHPDDIVNTDWLPFFIWSKIKLHIAYVHKFTYPTKKLVQYFKTVYGPYTNKIDWNQPKLYLKESREILLIAGDRRGLFYGIVNRELPDSVKGKNYSLPLITLRLKIKNPYLGMMYCDDHYATIMAELGTEPVSTKDKEQEAAVLNFRGTGISVKRDIRGERMIAKLLADRKADAEARKYIKVGTNIGEFDARIRNFK